jgi:hypothetical protein
MENQNQLEERGSDAGLPLIAYRTADTTTLSWIYALVGWYLVAYSAMTVLGGTMPLVLLGTHDREVVVNAVRGTLAAPPLVAGIAMIRRRSWGAVAAIVFESLKAITLRGVQAYAAFDRFRTGFPTAGIYLWLGLSYIGWGLVNTLLPLCVWRKCRQEGLFARAPLPEDALPAPGGASHR